MNRKIYGQSMAISHLDHRIIRYLIHNIILIAILLLSILSSLLSRSLNFKMCFILFKIETSDGQQNTTAC